MSATATVRDPVGEHPARDPVREVVAANRAGRAVGITSVCSAHPLVLEAALGQALADGTVALVEATSNQVDQFGGYTGQRPAGFRTSVLDLADRVGLPRDRVVLGGDHLGPNTWRGLGADAAMDRAADLVHAYVSAGFTKIHLDCSMVCAGDPLTLSDELVAARAARLARVAEDAAVAATGTSRLVYVVGTEVPVPGGAREELSGLTPTTPAAAEATVDHHHAAFAGAGLADAWERVVGLVVQPGVEFDHAGVVEYDPTRTGALRGVLDAHPHLAFEAHSTDYQTIGSLTALVRDHWAVLKVGPGLTFALREALFALAAMEEALVPAAGRSHLLEVLDAAMLREPKWWRDHHHGDADQQLYARRYSFSDRVRYYWPDDGVQAAQQRLFANLAGGVPLPLLSQYLPDQYTRVRAGVLRAHPRDLVLDRVRDVLAGYARACSAGALEGP